MGRSPETEQAESSSRSDSRQLQGPVADDARAEQRRRFPGRESGRQRIHPARIRREPLRIAAVPVPPGERRRETEVLAAGDAERAASAGRSDPADPDAIAGAETRHSRPDRRDGSRGLVPGDDRKPRRHFSFENVEVRPADAARFDRDLDFPGPRGRRRDLDGEKRRLLGRGRPLEPHGAHRCDSLARNYDQRAMRRIDALFADYGASHSVRGNLLCHAAGITLIVFGLLSFLARVPIAGVWTASELLVVLAFGFYSALDFPLALAVLGYAEHPRRRSARGGELAAGPRGLRRGLGAPGNRACGVREESARLPPQPRASSGRAGVPGRRGARYSEGDRRRQQKVVMTASGWSSR